MAAVEVDQRAAVRGSGRSPRRPRPARPGCGRRRGGASAPRRARAWQDGRRRLRRGRGHRALLRSDSATAQSQPRPAGVKPAVSGKPSSRFIHWMPPPAAPFTRLSIAEKTTRWSPRRRPPRGGAVGPHHVLEARRIGQDLDERRSGVEAGERLADLRRRASAAQPRLERGVDAARERPRLRREEDLRVDARGRLGQRPHLGLVPVRAAGCRRRGCSAAPGGGWWRSASRPAPVLPVTATTERRGSTSPSFEQRHGGEQRRGDEAAGMADVAPRGVVRAGAPAGRSGTRRQAARRAVRVAVDRLVGARRRAKRKSAETSTTLTALPASSAALSSSSSRGAAAPWGAAQSTRERSCVAPPITRASLRRAPGRTPARG